MTKHLVISSRINKPNEALRKKYLRKENLFLDSYNRFLIRVLLDKKSTLLNRDSSKDTESHKESGVVDLSTELISRIKSTKVSVVEDIYEIY